ncbi:hypothetical protein A4G18_08185 [Pasteurellaceae bacterium Pebbles2]|nr:hypothetical protein [Pasteurellaceae bacterium Pebbles2]
MYWDDINQKLIDVKLMNKKYKLLFNGYNTLYECFCQSYQSYSENEFIIEYKTENVLKYKDVNNIIDTISLNLSKYSNHKNSLKVGVLLESSSNYLAMLLAINKLGWVAVLYPTKYNAAEIAGLLDVVEVDLIITESSLFDKLNRDNLNIIDIDDLLSPSLIQGGSDFNKNKMINTQELEKDAVIMFTSGTTSMSKAIVLKNFNLIHAIESYRAIFSLTSSDKTVLATPIYNITGIIGILCSMMSAGGAVYLHQKFNIKDLLSNLIRDGITYFHASPTVFKKVIDEAKGNILSSIRIVACGSSMLSTCDIETLKTIMLNSSIRIIYGLTESSSPGAIFPIDAYGHQKSCSSGVAIPGFEIRVIDDKFNDLGCDRVGELAIRGTNVTSQYIPFSSKLIDQDGFVRTGDIGYIDSEGFVFIKDRLKDIVNKGGEKIFCLEVENSLSSLENVKEIAVVAKKDLVYGEVPVAFISTVDGLCIEKDKIKHFLATRLAKFKHPVNYYFIPEIIKTKNNKIDKKFLRELVNKL